MPTSDDKQSKPLTNIERFAMLSTARPTITRRGSDPIRNRPSPRPRFQVNPESTTTRARQSQPQEGQAVAGPSTLRPRPVLYADPDEHWLSEDEGEMHSRDVERNRRAARQDDNSDDDDSGNSGKDPYGGAKEGPGSESLQDHHRGHTIHHRPANNFQFDGNHKDIMSSIKDYSNLVSTLTNILQCPTCNCLVEEPTTLVCGHSLCLMCTLSTASNLPDSLSPFRPSTPSLTLNPVSLVVSASDSSEITQPTTPLEHCHHTQARRATTVVHQDTFCPISTCGRLTKATAKARSGLHIDYALHSVATLVAKYVTLHCSDDEVQAMAESMTSTTLTPPQDSPMSLLGSSPEDSPHEQESGKRNMGSRRDGWLSSKRNKITGQSHRHHPSTLPTPALLNLASDIVSELECKVCVTLLHEPLTTPCGHTFCKKCLFSSLDHSTRCPLCRSELPGIESFMTAPSNFTISKLIAKAFPTLHAERQQQEEEQEERGLDTPIFICIVSFPYMPTNLHIYEPKYRLMMRRAMDSNKRFGMVLRNRDRPGFSQHGTMLEIKNMTMFEDGRSLVETTGLFRFKILESGLLDGYTVGRIERIEDIDDEQEAELERVALARSSAAQARSGGSTHSHAAPTTPSISLTPSNNISLTAHDTMSASSEAVLNSESEVPEVTTKELVDICRQFVEALRTGSTPWLLERLNNSLPPMPDDPREFTWWMAMLMPVDDSEKAKLLQITSYRLRLRLLVFWIQQMQHSWWFSRGCTIC